jgi:tRNA G10  N-methylase Trm11
VKEANVFTNFEQYQLPKPEILRMDCTNDLLKSREMFDAIICDPPYGLRASAQVSGLRDRPNRKEISEEKEREIKEKAEKEKSMNEYKDTFSYVASEPKQASH